MLEDLALYGLIALLLFVIFGGKSKEREMEVSRYDDHVIEVVARKFTLVDKRAKKWD